MSLFGRALAGVGEGAGRIANKYIDADLEQQRQQALADLQIKTAATVREQDDAFRNDPNRVARDRSNKVADITATGDAQNSVALAGARAAATDTTLQAANLKNETARAGAVTKATAEAQVAAELKKITDPAYISAVRKEALARHVESAGSVAQAALANFQLGVAKNMNTLRTQLAEAQTTGNKDAAESIQAQIDALDGKGGKVDKFYAIAEKSTSAMAQANKILNDPMGTPDAKEEAQTQIRQQRMLMESAAKRAGVDLSGGRFPAPPQGAMDFLKKNPTTAADFDAKFGEGAAAKILGGAQNGPPKPSIADQAARAAPKPATPDSPQAIAADQAKQQLSQAQAALNRYGSIQRQRDPVGFAAAQQAVQQAQQASQQAEQAYSASVNTTANNRPAIRYPAP